MSPTHSRALFLASFAVTSLVAVMTACTTNDDVAGGTIDAGNGADSAPITQDGSVSPADTWSPPTASDAGSSDAATAKPTNGCALTTAGYPVGTSTASISVGGVQRTFRVHVPPGYVKNAATPIVLVLHGGGGSGQQIENESADLDPIADREGFITVYPDGTGLLKTWNAGLCCGKAVEDDVDDLSFISALLDDVEAKLCADERRVFVTGMSNGAIMSHKIACGMSDRIAAIAPVAGTIGIPTCTPTSKVAVMEIHGTNDGHVPWDGGFGCGPSDVDFNSVPATIEGWRTRNGCTATTTPYFQQGDGTCAAYQGCQTPVILCTIAGGGHSWPGGEPKPSDGGVIDCPLDGFQSKTFLASEAMWTFFKANPKPL